MARHKILHVMWNMDIGGAERAVYQLIREQRRTGLDSNVLILNKKGHYGELCGETGAKVYFMKMERAYDKSIKRKFLEVIKDFDIIHFHSAEPYPIYLSSLNPDIKKYYTHRGGVFAYTFFKSLRYKYCGRLFRKYFSGISGNTREGAKAASKLFNIPIENIAITYNGIDFSLLKPKMIKSDILHELNLNENNLILGTSANLRKWKRIDYLIKCVRLLNDDSIKCLIIGDGPEKNALENLTIKLKLQDRVIFTGKKEHIADYLQIVDIFVLPSESLESFGNSAVEAMSMGITTIIMQDGGGLREHIIDGKTGLIANDLDDLSVILKNIIEDKSKREKIGSESVNYVTNKYSLSNMIRQYDIFYKL